MIPVLAIFASGWLLGLLFPWRLTTPMVRGLLERAIYDLRQGWPEAALDNLGRALALLAPAAKERAR
jgi:hypothetical protein